MTVNHIRCEFAKVVEEALEGNKAQLQKKRQKREDDGGRGQGDGGVRGGGAAAAADGRGAPKQNGAGHECTSGPVSAQGRGVCARMQRFRAFLEALKLDAVYLDGAHDKC